MRGIRLLAVLLPGLWLGHLAQAQVVDPVRYAIVKAGYVLNLLRLTEWPDFAFATEESPLVVLVVGEDPMMPYLEEITRGERIGDRDIVVRRVIPPDGGDSPAPPASDESFEEALLNAHLVFVGHGAMDYLESILNIVAGYPVLTVSDIPQFAASEGGMIGLVVQGGTVGLEANVQHLDASGVRVSARVLQLASIVAE